MIAGIVLAAGASSRLGRPKQLLPIDGEPLLRHTLRRVLASSLDRVVVVIGHEADSVRQTVADLPVEIVVNPDAMRGQSTSVVAGLQALSAETDAAVFLLGDQPGVEPEVIDALIAAWHESRPPVVAPRYRDGLVGNPVLFDRRVFSQLLALEGDTGARPIVSAFQQTGELHQVPIDAPSPPDIDTEGDYAALLTTLDHPPLPAHRERGAGG